MKLFDWLKPKKVAATASAATPTLDEVRLVTRISQASDGGLLGPEEWSAVDRLIARGAEHQVLELLRRWIAVQPADDAATLRLCELLCGRLEHAAARPLLERLTTRAWNARALVLLGEADERAGDPKAALRSYERVLAYELDHSRARSAADRLRELEPALKDAPVTLDGPAQVGTPIGGRYKLVDELGRGSSGTVYLAEDVVIGREVALKILHPRSARDRGDARVRAWEEARISASLRHPNVVAIFDLDEERQIIAMELCRAGSLRGATLGPVETLLVLGQLLSALAAAHARGVVHGDVKPANVLLRGPIAPDAIVLCDFGIAHLANDLTHAQHGTLVYMAPEQRHGTATTASDVYAAGIVALELLTGPTIHDRTALLRGDALDLAALGVLPAPAQSTIRSLLANDPAARPSAADAARML